MTLFASDMPEIAARLTLIAESFASSDLSVHRMIDALEDLGNEAAVIETAMTIIEETPCPR